MKTKNTLPPPPPLVGNCMLNGKTKSISHIFWKLHLFYDILCALPLTLAAPLYSINYQMTGCWMLSACSMVMNIPLNSPWNSSNFRLLSIEQEVQSNFWNEALIKSHLWKVFLSYSSLKFILFYYTCVKTCQRVQAWSLEIIPNLASINLTSSPL